MQKFLFILAALLCLSSISVQCYSSTIQLSTEEKLWLTEHQSIRVSGPQAFPPFQFFNEDGIFVGIASEYLDYIATQLGLTISYLPQTTWASVLEMLQKKELDLLTCAAYTEERSEYLLFAEPHLNFPLVIITRKDVSNIRQVNDIGGLRVALQPKVSTEDELRKLKIDYSLYQVVSPTEALRAVSMGNADVAIENLAAASYIIDKEGLTNLKIAASTGIQSYSLSIAIRKDWPVLQSILNKSLASIPEEKHREIRQKWFSVRYEHGVRIYDSVKWIVLFLGIASMIIVGIFLRNRRLAREIKEREKIELKLRESERKLLTLISNLPGMAYRCRNEPGWPMEFISEGCFDVTGHLPSEISKNAPLKYGDIIHPEDQKYVWETVQACIVKDQVFEMEYRIVSKSGETKWVWERGSCVSDIQTGDVYLEGFISDITRQKKLAENLQHAQKVEAIGTLAGGIAHDFNNILQAILGYSEIISQDLPPDSRSKEDIKEITSCAMRASELVKQILAFSRQDERDVHPLIPERIVLESIRMLHSTLPRTVSILHNIAPNPLPILADEKGIQQIVLNLCNNGLQALDKQKGVIKVTLESLTLDSDDCALRDIPKVGTYTVLTVEDSGSGMDHTTLKNIFDPYFTTKGLGSGTGLGLAAIHGIVDNYNGYIRVSSSPGRGSKFSVYIPALLSSEHQPKLPFDVMETKGTGSEKEAKKQIILLVDDEPSLREIISRQLANKGYTIESHPSGEQALQAFKNDPKKYSLLLTDQTMPTMTGVELTRNILKVDESVPVILYTGHSDIVDEKKALEIGVKQFLYKPINRETLLDAVQKHCRKS